MDTTPLSPAPLARSHDVNLAESGPEAYQIHIPTRYLELTQQKFANARLPGEFSEDVDGKGTRSEMDALIDHWHETYSWRHEESQLNALPQYRLIIPIAPFGPLRHHFFWHRALPPPSSKFHHPAPLQLPILLVGELWEFLRLFRILQQSSAADVVLPSPPGLGFSDAPAARGFCATKCAQGFHALMRRLGYASYVVHGSGEVGTAVARALALLFPREVHGVHLCAPRPGVPRRWWARVQLGVGRALGKEWARRCQKGVEEEEEERGGSPVWVYALTDSPMGLLSWVAGRIRRGATGRHSWTHAEILNAFMYFWVSGPRDFFPLFSPSPDDDDGRYSPVPLGVFIGGGDAAPPKRYLAAVWGGKVVFETRRKAPVGRWTTWEEPEVVAESLVRFSVVVGT